MDKSNQEKEIEVTPEMIREGVTLLEESGYLASEGCSGLNLVVQELFDRMLAVRRGRSEC